MQNHHYLLILHLSRNLMVGFIFIAAALLLGMSGYHYFEGMAWIDAFENASMILSGMGPVQQLTHPGAQIFAGCYALFCGLGFIGMMALVFTPLMHYLFRRIHLEGK